MSLVLCLFFLARLHVDHGGTLLMASTRYYARRWAFPDAKAAAQLKPILRSIGLNTHASLHDQRDWARDKIVLLVFDRKSRLPVMFHLGFKAEYYQQIVFHLGLAMVEPSHQGQSLHLQRVKIINTALNFLTFLTTSFVFTDIREPYGGTQSFSDIATECYPNIRFNNDKACGGGPKPWQADIAAFMMANHRKDIGASPSAVLDRDTFAVQGAGKSEEVGEGELFQVGRANLFFLAGRSILMKSKVARVIYVILVLLSTAFQLIACALARRHDLMYVIAKNTMFWLGIEVQISGESTSDSVYSEKRFLTDSSLDLPCGTLWVSNHYTLFDYTVLHLVSKQVLRTIVKADIADELPVLGPLTSIFLFKYMGCIPYKVRFSSIICFPKYSK